MQDKSGGPGRLPADGREAGSREAGTRSRLGRNVLITLAAGASLAACQPGATTAPDLGSSGPGYTDDSSDGQSGGASGSGASGPAPSGSGASGSGESGSDGGGSGGG